MARNDKAAKPSGDLQPSPVLAVGMTGHRNIVRDDHTRHSLSATLDKLFENLKHSLEKVVHHDHAFFSNAEPVVRVIGMAAEGADLLCARSASAAGAEIACVLPFGFDEYRNDFSSPVAQELARSIIAAAQARFILPGCREEGPRAYERANHVILANIDLLIAVWDGKRANGRAGTGDVVQAAVSRGIPVVVVEPNAPAVPTLLAARGDEALETSIATDHPREPLDGDLTSLISQIMSPPAGSTRRQGLVDLMAETSTARSLRFEYPLMLKLFRVARARKTVDAAPAARSEASRDAAASTASMSREPAPRLIELQRRTDRIDDLAVHYGRLFRSSSTSGFLLIIVATLFSSIAWVFFPSIFGLSIVAQAAVNGLVMIDAMIRGRRRWQERWLDYRLIAERLRCLRFLHPLGLGLDQTSESFKRDDQSWAEWYVRRCERALGPPVGEMQDADVARGARRLADSDIPGQLHYHRTTFRQLGLLERRLGLAASLALGATIMVAAAFGITAYIEGGVGAVTWKPIAMLVLFVLPAATTAFNGVRADADLVRVAERAATTAAALARLRRIMSSTSMSYDRLAVAAGRAAAIMGGELSEWRFVLESRRVRAKRGRGLGRRRLLRLR